MQWIKKKLGGDGDSKSAPFIVGSHTWLGSTTDHKGEKASPVVYEPPVEETEQHGGDSGDSKSMERSQSMTPPSGSSSTDMSRSKSLGSALKNGFSRGDKKQQQQQPSAMYPKVYEGKSMEELAKEEGSEEDDGDDSPVEAREECLVTVPNAMVHLIDDQQSPHLATGHFSIVRITQKGRGKGKGSKNWNGIVVLVRVGEHLHWPLMKDEATVKLDPTHYFFTLPVPSSLEEKSGDSNSEEKTSTDNIETLNYGVTFADIKNYEKELKDVDHYLEMYSSFSSPTLVHGDEKKEEFIQQGKQMTAADGKRKGSKEQPAVDKHGGMVVPQEVVTSDGKQVAVTEENQSEFWTTMAPNVDDYGSYAARAIAIGSGHVIKSIFWVRDSTVKQLESGTIYLTSKMNPSNKPSNISPRTLRNLRRVRNMSRATENVAKGVLSGIVMTAGFFSGAIIKSSVGKKVFKLMPGEVALVSLDAFGKLFDALEKATTDVLGSTSLMTQNVISHKFGESAGQVTQETLATAGHVVATAWTVSKLRKALNPKDGVKPTKTGMVTGLAKNVIKGK